ncbi:MAG TPA: TetR/AcrR family transcriptional regulator [Kofleriaceae bacterium]|nr:TetR/AcrR family transcriptional regulator [Kofleriaceae bacterium]
MLRPRRRIARARIEQRTRRRERMETDERRAQLLALGMRLFAERTYDEISMDDLAREAGVSKGLVYHYFKTKRDFYVAGLREIARDLLEKTTTHAPELAPLERIKQGLDAYLDHVKSNARGFIALMRGGIGSDPEVASVVEGTRTAYVDRFLHDIAGTPLASFAAKNTMIRTAFRGWLGFVEAASLDWLSHDDVDRVRLRDMMIEMLLSTLRVVGAPFTP